MAFDLSKLDMKNVTSVTLVDVEPGATNIQEQNITNYYAGDKPQKAEKPEPAHPIAPFIAAKQKEVEVIEWLHTNIDSHKDKNVKLEFLKAAMESSPRAVQDTVTLDIFNAEFGTNISEATFLDCIRGYHKFHYGNDFEVYRKEISAIIDPNL